MLKANKKINIGIDARMWGAKQTGIGRYISSLSEKLVYLAPDCNFILFMRNPEYASHLKNKNIQVIKAKERWYSFGEQLIFPARLMRHSLDVLFVPHFNVPLFWRGKFVSTIHDVTPLFYPGPLQSRYNLRKAAFKKVFESTLKKARRIIAVSSYTRDEIIKNFHADKEKITVIYEGISALGMSGGQLTVLSTGDLNAHKDKYGLKKPYIFFVGVWRPHKNIVGLLEAFATIKKLSGGKYALVLGGEEDSRYPEIRATWQKLGLESDIIRPGFIPDTELPFWYKASSAVVIPSFMEGFGLVGLEAISCGASVVASLGGATPEILQDAAVYFNPYNSEEMAQKILYVMESLEERERQRVAVAKIIPLYSWENNALQTMAILRQAAS